MLHFKFSPPSSSADIFETLAFLKDVLARMQGHEVSRRSCVVTQTMSNRCPFDASSCMARYRCPHLMHGSASVYTCCAASLSRTHCGSTGAAAQLSVESLSRRVPLCFQAHCKRAEDPE